MIIQVKLLNGFPEPLLYSIPSSWNTNQLIGTLVRVPLKDRTVSAMVIDQFAHIPSHVTYSIKDAIAPEPLPDDQYYQAYIKQLAHYYQLDKVYLLKRLAHFLVQKEVEEEITQTTQPQPHQSVILTNEQQQVVDFVAPHIHNPAFTPTLLHGVTGSGKTEVYKQLICQAIAQQKTVLLLLPEVSLAQQFQKILTAQLPNHLTIAGFHSGTTAKEKKQLWQLLLQQKPMLIIGVHLPILLPIANLGLIIVDEEHEVGYQEKKHPKINTKEAALMRAQHTKIPILLGSATPSVGSLYNVKQRGWHFFQLTKRFAGNFPTVSTVVLKDHKQRKNFWISNQLYDALKDRLQKNEQAIIFINRRGFSFFVQCKSCSYIFECKSCSVSLTFHEPDVLTCHYCAHTKKLPTHCTGCKASGDNFLKKGIGTQQAVTILQKLFPDARIARADMDVTVKKKLWKQTVTDFEQGNIDILVGTQTITKGYHFPKVTLVGILWADLNLHFPIFNASEVTLQQLIQVAGRAGRQTSESNVIVQTMVDHPVLEYLNEIDYVKFYEQEIEHRMELQYPPCSRFVEIEIKHASESIIEFEAHKLVDQLIANSSNLENVYILGPAKPPIYKIKSMQSRKIYIKAPQVTTINALFASINKKQFKSLLFFTPNPVH